MGFLTALGFLTVLPVPARAKLAPGRALPYFPLAGLLLGLIVAGLYYVLRQLLPAEVTAASMVVALALLTGGHHLDGLADTFTGLKGGSREKRLELMTGTRAGAAGVAAITLLLLAKFLALGQITSIPGLLAAPALARGAVLSAIFIFPAAKSSGMGYAFKQGFGWRGLTVATIISLLLTATLFGPNGLVLAGALYFGVLGFGYYLSRRLGGLTGDTYGALIEMGEVLVLSLASLL